MTLKPTSNAAGTSRTWRQRLLPVSGALLATLLSLPGAAVEYPDVPLQSGKAYPPANMMYIQDDSGSMAFERMPDEGGLNASINARSYVHNTIYYNPSVDYFPWMQANGARRTGGTNYTSAFNDAMQPSGNIDLSNNDRIFYVPKANATTVAQLASGANYDRYRIYETGGAIYIEQCTKSDSTNINATNATWDSKNCTKNKQSDTPTGRSVNDELTNYATWHSYHRTRGKVAKAGASEAFNLVGENIRVGYDSIHNRNPRLIPVATDGGLFRGANRANWFSSVQASIASNNTPLRTALARTGAYYQQTQNSGPWATGPTGSDTQLSCRQNFAILTTDGYWNGATNTIPAAVGDSDGTAGPAITVDGNYNYVPVSPYRDNFSSNPSTQPNTLADVAMHYWKNDLRTDLKNDVAKSSEDPAFWQHMVTFGVSIGLQGKLNPKTDLASITNGSKRWGNPLDAFDGDRVDDLWHASVNGRGKFIVASNTKEFTQGILDAVNVVAERQGSASNVTTNSTSFSSDTRIYQAKYVSGKWTGDLEAYDATAAGVAAAPAWKASEQVPAWDSRKIFTWNTTGGATFPTVLQTAALNQSLRITSPVSGADNASYIKGDASRERRNGGELRNRDVLLGDIVNSSPTYVRDSETIFVGANDGMLHAFAAKASGSGNNAVTAGQELFAYVPGGISLTGLATLSDPNYQHKYFVDGPVMVSSKTQTPGKNYLVGALGRGGKGLFGLDVTTPKSFAANDVKWELTTGANLGQILGESLIVTLNDTARTKAVIFGNGINSTSGRAVLYVVNIATGAIIQQIDTGVAGDNGMSAPRGWDDNLDGTVDYVYAGDLKGNLWKFDFTSTTGAGSIAFGGSPMFASGVSQPITSAVALAKDPKTGKRWVFVGTGSFISTADFTNTAVQSVYGLIDEGATAITKGQLTKRDIVVTTTLNGRTVRGFETNGTLATTSRGWYVDLDKPTPGERVVNRPQVRGSVLIFASIIPPVDDPCDVGGTGFINALDAFTGTSTGDPYFDANGDRVVNGDDQVTTANGKVPVGSIDPGVGMPTLPTIIDNLVVVGGSLGNLGDVIVSPQSGPPRRTSWHEVVRD